MKIGKRYWFYASDDAKRIRSGLFTPYDNACAETFFKTIKVECIDNAHFKTREEASDAISRYLLFYNRLRIHQSLGYLSPVEFERLFAA